MKAYDLEVLKRPADRTDPAQQGWCFGLPPGISPEQWPLDPKTGYSLMHVFTLLLPEEYRIHGPDIVALSFFATAPDHIEGDSIPGLKEIMEEAASGPPSDPSLLPFWQAARASHPRLSRMEDVLESDYAVILLTRAEFDGPLCQPPSIAHPLHQDKVQAPEWLKMGSAAAYWETSYHPSSSLPAEDYHVYKQLGEIPEKSLLFDRALKWTPRMSDPNAGKDPREWSSDETGYQLHYYWADDKLGKENYREHDWVKDHKPNHIGGTMNPLQAMPEFSPYYIEFEEYLGGCNFGGGNAQLDFRDMKFDWAC